MAFALGALLLVASAAEPWTRQDVPPAISAAAENYGVSEALLACMAFRESSNNPYAIGAAGERGVFQLKPGVGRLNDFFARGYTDEWSPYQQADYVAQSIREGTGSAWTTYRGCL